jgi:hypothetical protein
VRTFGRRLGQTGCLASASAIALCAVPLAMGLAHLAGPQQHGAGEIVGGLLALLAMAGPFSALALASIDVVVRRRWVSWVLAIIAAVVSTTFMVQWPVPTLWVVASLLALVVVIVAVAGSFAMSVPTREDAGEQADAPDEVRDGSENHGLRW